MDEISIIVINCICGWWHYYNDAQSLPVDCPACGISFRELRLAETEESFGWAIASRLPREAATPQRRPTTLEENDWPDIVLEDILDAEFVA